MGMGYIGTVGMALYTAGHVLKAFKGQVGWMSPTTWEFGLQPHLQDELFGVMNISRHSFLG